MFVDDEPDVLAALRRGLRTRRDSWRMDFQLSAHEALESVRSDPPAVAILDIRMPEMSGLDLAREIRATSAETQCLILLGSTDFSLAVASLNDGNVFRYYMKPCEFGDLTSGIEDALRRHRARSAELAPPGISPSQMALEIIHYGVIVVDGKAQVLFANPRAGDLLSRVGGLSLDAVGICRTERTDETERLHHAIADAQSNQETTALSLSDGDRAPLRVTVQPYLDTSKGRDPDKRREDADTPVCLFVFAGDHVARIDPKLLRSMFGLTIAESRLAATLAEGLTLEAAATECGVTVSSARTYLKSVFSKLGVSRQSELVRTILISLAMS
jgi:DNA-binding NarL/FixJ family response regulator